MPSNTPTPTIELAELKPSQLVVHPKNIRKDVGDVSTLADSLAAQGVQQPLKVAPNGKPDRYIVIAGHRRLAAAKLARLKTLPCVIDHGLTDEADQIAAMLAENIEREDLTPVEEAAGVELLLDLKLNQKEIASRTGMSAARVRTRAKIAKLSDEVKAQLTEHEVTLADAEFIATHAGNARDLELLEEALGTRNWELAKQQQLERVEARRQKVRWTKEAAALGIVVVDNHQDWRNAVTAATKDLGLDYADVTLMNAGNAYPWPAPADVLERIAQPDTRAVLHVSEKKNLYVKPRHDKPTYAELIVLTKPAEPEPVPAADTTEPAADDSATEPAVSDEQGTPTVVEDTPPAQEPAPSAYDEELERRSLRESAAEVRRKFIRGKAGNADSDFAVRIAAYVADALSRRDFGDVIDQDNFGRAPMRHFVPAHDPFAEDVPMLPTERRAAVLGWIRAEEVPASMLIGFVAHWLVPIDEWVTNADPDEHGEEELIMLVRYLDVLRESGFILSDVEVETREAFRAAIDESMRNEI